MLKFYELNDAVALAVWHAFTKFQEQIGVPVNKHSRLSKGAISILLLALAYTKPHMLTGRVLRIPHDHVEAGAHHKTHDEMCQDALNTTSPTGALRIMFV